MATRGAPACGTSRNCIEPRLDRDRGQLARRAFGMDRIRRNRRRRDESRSLKRFVAIEERQPDLAHRLPAGLPEALVRAGQETVPKRESPLKLMLGSGDEVTGIHADRRE